MAAGVTGFQAQVITALAKLEAGQTTTNDHLGKLNGSVERHNREIAALQTADAITKQAAATREKWVTRMHPAIWAVIGVFVYFCLRDGSNVVKLFIH